MWSAFRWHAYNIMAAMPYVDLRQHGIHRPTDLLKFPWDDDARDLPSDDEIEELNQMLLEEQKAIKWE